jgi:hypothetical protein
MGRIEVGIDVDLAKAREAGTILRAIILSYKGLAIWQSDADLKTKLSLRLDAAKPMISSIVDSYEELSAILGIPIPADGVPTTACVINRTITERPITDAARLLAFNFEKLSSLVPTAEKFKENANTLLAVNFIENFLTEVEMIQAKIRANLTDINTLLDNKVPPSFMTQNCLFNHSTHEQEHVNCYTSGKSIICAVHIRSNARTDTAILTILPVSYPGAGGGCELWVPDTLENFWGINSATGTIHEYKCELDADKRSDVGFCTETEIKSACGKAMSTNAISEMIAACRFKYKSAEPAIRLPDGGILIQASDALTYQAEHLIMKDTPFIVKSNDEIIVETAAGGKITFPPDVAFQPARILISALSLIQRTQVAGNCVYNQLFTDPLEEMNVFDVTSFSMYASMIPMIGSLLLYVCCCLKRAKTPAAHAHKMTRAQRQHQHVRNEAFLRRTSM